MDDSTQLTGERVEAVAGRPVQTDPPGRPDHYRVPVIGTQVPASMVETGFWGGLLGAAALGAVDPPLAILVGAGVAIARHRRS